MQSPTGVATKNVYAVAGRVLINGTDVGFNVKSVELDREAPDGTPGSSGAMRSATCTVVADATESLTNVAPSPLTGTSSWPPTPSDRVEVWLSDGENEWRQIIGHVDDPEGSTSRGEITFTVRDRYQTLRKPVRIPVLSNAMPPLQDATPWLYIGLQPLYLADSAARQCNRYATPPMMNRCAVSVPMMGSTWPQRGTLRESVRRQADSVGQAYPSWVQSPYGLCASNVDVVVEPWSGTTLTLDDPLEVIQELPERAGNTSIFVRFNPGTLEVSTNNTTAFVRYTPTSGPRRELAELRLDADGGYDRIAVRYSRSGSELNGQLRLYNTATGRSSSTASGRAYIFSGDLAGDLTSVRAYSTTTLGAFQVGFPPAWQRLTHQANAQFNVSALANTLVGTPHIYDTSGAELLERIAKAEMASWWIDENDVLQWWSRQRFTARGPVATLTAQEHINELAWSHTGGSQVERVHVDYKHPHKTQRWRTNLTLWQGGSGTMEQGDDEEMIVSTPNDEVWLGVDASPVRYSANTTNYWAINRGIKSLMGGIRISESGNEGLTNSVIPSFRKISDETWAFAHRIGSLGNDWTASLSLPDEFTTDNAIWARHRGENLPILRGMGKVVFEDASYTSPVRGPNVNADLTHDVGWLVQSSGVAQRLANEMAEVVTQPQFKLRDVSITPVFNLQVGDTVTLDDPIALGASIRGVVTAISLNVDFGTGAVDQSISVRIRDWQLTKGTVWRDFGRTWDSRSWRQFARERQGETWQDFGNDPLKPLGG